MSLSTLLMFELTMTRTQGLPGRILSVSDRIADAFTAALVAVHSPWWSRSRALLPRLARPTAAPSVNSGRATPPAPTPHAKRSVVA